MFALPGVYILASQKNCSPPCRNSSLFFGTFITGFFKFFRFFSPPSNSSLLFNLDKNFPLLQGGKWPEYISLYFRDIKASGLYFLIYQWSLDQMVEYKRANHKSALSANRIQLQPVANRFHEENLTNENALSLSAATNQNSLPIQLLSNQGSLFC